MVRLQPNTAVAVGRRTAQMPASAVSDANALRKSCWKPRMASLWE